MTKRPLFWALASAVLLSNQVSAGSKFPSSSSGGVVIRSIDSRTLVVAVDSTDGDHEMDGLADLTFYYTSDDLPAQPVSFQIPFANVEHSSRGGFLRVTSPEYGQILFIRIGRQAPEVVSEAGPLSSKDEEAESRSWWLYDTNGLGLSAYRGRQEFSLEKLATQGLLEAALEKALPTISYDDIGAPGTPAGCQGGGPGATSCSRTCGNEACETACQSPSYACCKCVAGIPYCNCLR